MPQQEKNITPNFDWAVDSDSFPLYQLAVEQLVSIPVDIFFEQLVERLANFFGCDYVMVLQSCNMESDVVKPLAFWAKGQLESLAEFSTINTPYSELKRQSSCRYGEEVQQLFPADVFIKKHRITAFVALPLLNAKDQVIGYLTMMSADSKIREYPFSILRAYAGRASVELERRLHNQEVEALIEGYCLPVEQGLFAQLAKIIGDVLDVDYAIISHIPKNGGDVLESVVAYNRGALLPTFQYPIKNSPCEKVVGNQLQSYPERVQELFPEFSLLQDLNAQGYVGAPLFDSNGDALGVLAVISERPIKNVPKITPLLVAFSNRVAHEVERQRSEDFIRHYHDILSATDDLMSFVDTNYIYRAVNNAYCLKFNKSITEIVNHSVLELHGRDVFYGGLQASLDISLREGQAITTEFERKAPDGSVRWIQGQHNPSFDSDNNIIGVVVSARDITELKLIQQALAHSEQRLQSMYDDAPAMFFTVDEQAFITSVNAYGATDLGYRVDELMNTNISQIFLPDDRAAFMAKLKLCFAEPDNAHSWELRKISRSGKVIWVKETARVVTDHNNLCKVFIVSEDISEKHKLSQKLSYQASHDALTNLVNRHEFERLLQQLLDNDNDKAEHVLCYLDLDQFKLVNDSCGHLAGDLLLKNVADILHLKVRKSDVLARLGGDEFAILMEYCSLEQAKMIANTIRQLIQDYTFIWKNQAFSIGVSIGLVVISSKTDNLVKVMGSADEACYAAKAAGRNRVHIYRESDHEISRRRGETEWVRRIKQAVVDHQFCLYAQKISPVDPSSDIKPSYELLLRLRDNDSVVLPDSFFPAAERFNLATRIDEWVIAAAFRWLASPASRIDQMSHCAINLSGQSLSDEDFLAYVVFQIERLEVPADKICFEITETAAISNMAGAVRFINEFKQRGCLFALDDFGSGVSSFGYLKNLPVDFVKIDGCFVSDMVEDKIDYAMVRSINEIAHVMNKQTIAEYVESEKILECLQDIGVDFAQGHYIGRPQYIG